MKLVSALIASVFAVSAFAAEPAKKEEKPAAKPAASASAAKQADSAAKHAEKKVEPTKSAPAKDIKPEAAKK